MIRNLSITTIATFGLTAAATADPAALEATTEWKHDLTAYAFLPFSSEGTSNVAGQSVPIDLDLSDALDLLDFAVSGRYEGWTSDFGLIVDLNYLSLSADSTLPGPGGGSASVDIEQYWVGLLGAYRVASGTVNGTNRRYSVDVQGGARYNHLKQEAVISGPGPGMTLGGTATWWEPVIGVRAIWEINDRWTGAVLADAGGFGVNDSELQWSATLGFDYKINESSALKLGVRYYSIDYDGSLSGDDFGYDVTQVGPFIGYSYSF